MNTRIRSGLALAALAFLLASTGAGAQQPPIRIGSTLALTGPLAATALVHKTVGEIYVDQLNKRGGLLGRRVEWIVKDDQSKPDLARTLYEQLLTVDKVDLLMGPYATGAILSAMGIAQRYNKVLVHHTFGIPSLAKYECQFPAWSLGPVPEVDRAEHRVQRAGRDARSRRRRSPSSRASSRRCTSCRSARASSRRSAALKEVIFLEWDFGNLDYGPIAARIKDAKPDFVWVGAIGLEGNQLLEAMNKIDYSPPLHFYMYPAPGPMSKSPLAKNAMSMTMFEEHLPYTNAAGAKAFIDEYHVRAAKAGIPDTNVEVQAAASFTAWQILEAGVKGTKSLDDKAICAWLKANHVDTIQGKLRFDGPSNYGDDLMRVKQVQDGRWVTVFPKANAAPGATLRLQ